MFKQYSFMLKRVLYTTTEAFPEKKNRHARTVVVYTRHTCTFFFFCLCSWCHSRELNVTIIVFWNLFFDIYLEEICFLVRKLRQPVHMLFKCLYCNKNGRYAWTSVTFFLFNFFSWSVIQSNGTLKVMENYTLRVEW